MTKTTLLSLGIAAVALAVLLALGWHGDPAQAEASGLEDSAQPFVVKVHADWCGTCTRLEPTWHELEKELDGQARFVRFDVTDRASLSRSQQEAQRLGLVAFFEENKSKTGTIAVLDGATREPVAVLKGETDLTKYRDAVAKARASKHS